MLNCCLCKTKIIHLHLKQINAEFYTKKRMKLTRYFFICVIFLGNFAFTQSSLHQKLDNFSGFSGFETGSISLMAMDVTTGTTVLDYNAKTALPSASTMKLFSTASAIELVGPNYKAKTSLY